MNVPSPISFGNNYRLTIADNAVLAEIITQKMGGGLHMYKQVLEALRTGAQEVGKLAVHCLKTYNGILLPSLSIAEYHNIVPSVLRDELATLISGTTITPTLKANYFALGTGSSTPANADTTLQTESTRAAFTNRTSYQNVAYLDVFFPSTTVGGNTYTEAGIFVDGTASANTGYLLSRVAINQVLGSTQTLTVNCSITVS